ncbi:MAG: hypothetical protein HZB45_15470 [Mycolicibacterium rufum]|nr:hypothetical protein [Mycolicibacterium rufum]
MSTFRQRAIRALYEGSLAEVGDPNPYAGESLALAQLWRRGYKRMLSVRIECGTAMQRYRAGQAAAEDDSDR